MSDPQQPQKKLKIEFPCQYPIKVMGEANPALRQHILRILDIHAPGYNQTDITIKNSSKGNWQSITVLITATGKSQLDALFADLKNSTMVKIVL